MGRKKWLLWSVLGCAILAGVMLLLYFFWSAWGDACTLPTVREIKAMRAIYHRYDPDNPFPVPADPFPVPREKWAEILDAMTPAEEDKAPLKWQVLVLLLITKNDGRSLVIELFFLQKPPGAFCVNVSGKRVYFRGGDAVKLDALLRSVYKASHER